MLNIFGRGHQILVVSTKKKVPHLLDRIKLFIKGYGWWPSDPGPSHFDGLELEHRVINRFRPVTDSDLPDADVVVATWWETAEWVAQLSPAKGAKAQLIQQMETNFLHQPVDRVESTWSLPLQKIVVSQWLADLARDRFGDPTSVVVPNGIDLNLFHAPFGASSRVQPWGCFTFREALTRGTLRPVLRSTSQHGEFRTCSFALRYRTIDRLNALAA